MREILFRGKTYDTSKWVEGCYLPSIVCKDIYGYIMRDGSRSLDTILLSTIGQFTGLTDKNGKKIFEGDILIINNQHKHPVLVKFIDFSWTCVIPNNNAYLNYRHRLENNFTKYEIIGNTHDNPELLKEGKADV